MEFARRRMSYVTLALLVTFAALAAGYQDTARAQTVADPDYWAQTAERKATVERFVYGQSPQAIPASYDPVREAERILAEQQRTLPASSPEAQTLWTQIRNITVEEGLSTAPRALGTISLAAGTFYVGWKIGSGLNAKFLKIGVPEAIPHTNSDFRGNGFGQDLVWHAAGFRAEGGGKVIQPVDGFTWTRIVDGGYRYSYWKTGTPDSGCDMNRVAPPAELVIETATIAGKDCGYGQDRPSTDYHVGYVPDDQLGAPGAIEPYTNQPYSKSSSAPTPPAQSTVQQGIQNALDNPKYHVLRQWLNYRLGSPGETDPTSGAVNMPDCVGETIDACTAALTDLGITDYQVQTLPESNLSFANGEVVTSDPEPGTSVDPATVTITIAANPATRVKSEEDERCERDTYGAPGDPGPAPADGTGYPQFQAAPTPWNGPYAAFDPATTPWQPVNLLMRYGLQPTNIDEGWGWRHIKAKHGYGATEMNETEQALATDPAPTLMYASTRQYALHLYYEMPDGPGTIWCVRTALVEFNPDKNQLKMGDDSPKGVINSYTGLLLGTETP